MRHSSCCYHVSSFMNRANETIVRFATCVLAVAMICVPTSLRAADTGRLARVRQADGTTLSLRICGDEFFHYAVTSDGYSVDQGPDGFYYYLVERDGRPVRSNVRVSERGRRTADERRLLETLRPGVVATALRARAHRLRSETRAGLETGFPTTGEIRSVVILAAFSDVGFTVPDPQRAFERMLNEEGYSDNGALGSARDYYLDNSGGRFRPTFDVVGPVTLDHPVAYYGANTDYRDENAERMIIEACHKAERAGVDFSQYDFDNDGKIDNVFVYYAGHNESDGGGMNTVWPHRGEISYPGEMLGGKELCVYACTSELSGSPDFDSRMAGIGTFCHEFGHVLGWPDFYDTNGSDFGSGVGVFNWSLMCQGSRNDGGRTPPSLTAMERMMAGWLTPTTLTRSGDYDNLLTQPRPSHADRTAAVKFEGWNDPRGGGHFSGRLTLALVAAGVVAKKILGGATFSTRLTAVGGQTDPARFDDAIDDALRDEDSVGGIVECRVAGIPAGWGEPFFDSVESAAAHLLFAIPAIKGVEFGDGFAAAALRGSAHNDPIADADGRTATNHAGGIAGGITNGNELVVRAAVKPTASIAREPQTFDFAAGRVAPLRIRGRHAACIALRAAVVVEAAMAVALADFKLRDRCRRAAK